MTGLKDATRRAVRGQPLMSNRMPDSQKNGVPSVLSRFEKSRDIALKGDKAMDHASQKMNMNTMTSGNCSM